ncbi:MAG: FlgD immunoglobulin-like domain containing protein [bacterium]
MSKAIGVLLGLGLLCSLVGGANAACPDFVGTCADLQTGSYPSNPVDTVTVEIRGVIVTAVRSSGGSGGFWVQDPPSGGPGTQGDPFSGVFCYTGNNPWVSVGDSVTVRGAYIEFFLEQSELELRDSFLWTGCDSLITRHKVGAVVPAPKQLTVCDLAAVASNTLPPEQWEGVLVQLDSVRVKSDLPNGEWSIKEADGDSLCVGLADSSIVDDKMPITQPPDGTLLKTLTGVFDNTFGLLKLEPRGDADIVFAGPLPASTPDFTYVTSNTTLEVRWDYPLNPASATNIANYSLASGDFSLISAVLAESTLVRITTGNQAAFRNNPVPQVLQMQNIRNKDLVLMTPTSNEFIAGVCDINFVQTQKNAGAGNDTSVVAGYTVCVAGIVTAATSDEFYDDKFRFFVQNTGGGPRSGLEVRNFLGGNAINAARGDSVRVAGLVTDQFRSTKIQILDYFLKVGTKPVPTPNVVSLATAISEDYEGVLVRVNPPLVSRGTYPCDETVCFFEVPVGAAISGGDSLVINDSDRDGYGPITLSPGQTLCYVQGPMYFDFNVQKILPRSTADICIPGITGVDAGTVNIPVRTRLDQNLPNPFNPMTKITFGLAKDAPASLVVYDLTGRAVRTLVDGTLKAGEHTRFWDGRDSDGNSVSSGVYFYKLDADTFNQTRKMVLLK